MKRSDPDVLPADEQSPEPAVVDRIAATLRSGGIVALPADTLYGLSCDPYREDAVARLAAIKGYGVTRPFVILFDGSEGWLDRLTSCRSAAAERLRAEHWPGPLTLVLPAGPDAPGSVLSGKGTIALRHADHGLSAAVLRAFGGVMVSTSANRAGEDPLRSAPAIVAALGAEVDLIVDAGPRPDHPGSAVVDLTVDPPRLIRPGPLQLKL